MKVINQLIKKENFTNIESNISDYIILHKDEIALMSIQTLAKNTYSSNAAIIRLTKKLGCSGYKDFKIQIIKELESKRENNTYVDYNYPFHLDESTQSVSSNIALLYKNTIDHVYSNLDMKSLNNAAKLLLDADMIYYYGVGDSRLAGMRFDNKLNKIGRKLMNAESLGDSDTFTTWATDKDVAIIISYRGNNERFIRAAKLLKQNKVPIIILTANNKSELVKYSNIQLFIPDKLDNDESIATFYSSIAFDYVLDVLYSLIYGLRYTLSNKKRSKVISNQKS